MNIDESEWLSGVAVDRYDADLARLREVVADSLARMNNVVREFDYRLWDDEDDETEDSPEFSAVAERVAAGSLTWMEVYHGRTTDPDAAALHALLWQHLDAVNRERMSDGRH